ncbi:MAG: hypothetical protein RL660_2677 [Bacteroidota bacterium]|jgi:hypothetical protein
MYRANINALRQAIFSNCESALPMFILNLATNAVIVNLFFCLLTVLIHCFDLNYYSIIKYGLISTSMFIFLIYFFGAIRFKALSISVDSTILNKQYLYTEEGADFCRFVFEYKVLEETYTSTQIFTCKGWDVGTCIQLYVNPAKPSIFSLLPYLVPNKYLVLLLVLNYALLILPYCT